MKKFSLRKISDYKKANSLQMLTCYDYQTAQILNETNLDLILVGDSLGNVVLGYDSTISVSLEEMAILGAAVTRGAPDKFVVVDLPFGSYASFSDGLKNSINLYQKTNAHALKLEGAASYQLDLITRLTQNGVPVMGHIGLLPQSVNQQGGYFMHGKDDSSAQKILEQALHLEKAGAFAVVLECVEASTAKMITQKLSIPTIGIGSGRDVDGQVLVINDLLGMTKSAPKFATPIANLYQLKSEVLRKYLDDNRK